MALKRRNKISVEFSMASMSDMVFLLLIFFMITSTLISPNALKLLLPQSNSQTTTKPITTISITKDLKYYVNDNGALKSVSFQEIEPFIQSRYGIGNGETAISVHADRSIYLGHAVEVMNIIKRNNYVMILATAPE